jgi:hypothetical protein
MIHAVDPRQNRLFDPFDGVIPSLGRRIIADGWQGLFRHVLLEVMCRPIPANSGAGAFLAPFHEHPLGSIETKAHASSPKWLSRTPVHESVAWMI